MTPLRNSVFRSIGGLVLVAGLAAGLTGCSSVSSAINSVGEMSGMTGEHSATDLMFAAMMVPHHQQAVDMANLALQVSTNEDVRALAAQIRDAQAPEIQQMQAWLDAAGTGAQSGTPGHDHGMMNGMLDDAAMSALRAATGPQFDTLFLQGMIAHHQGAIVMADMLTGSDNAEANDLGATIKSGQSAEIERMKQLLNGM